MSLIERISFYSTSIIFFLFATFSSHATAEESFDYGPSLEVGIGVGVTQESNNPKWISTANAEGSMFGSLRLFKGLSVQGGYGRGLGKSPDFNELQLDTELQLDMVVGSYTENAWLGMRYEVPVVNSSWNKLGINTAHVTLGYNWAKYGISATEWTDNGDQHLDQPETQFDMATMSGPEIGAGIRWLLKISASEEEQLLDTFVFDLGIKYTKHMSHDMSYNPVDTIENELSTFRIYLKMGIKIELFEKVED